MSILDHVRPLPDMDNRPRAVPKGKSRVELKADAKPLTKVDEKAFKATVWKRDRDRCRCCHRKVLKTLSRVPERGEIHHIHGRGGDLRFEDKAALLLCLRDHERVTGRVSEKWSIVASATFTVKGQAFTDARQPVKFVRVA